MYALVVNVLLLVIGAPRMGLSRRQLVVSAIGAGLAGGLGAETARAATDDELAFANFGQATELLLADLYDRSVTSGLFERHGAREIRRAALNAREHAAALAGLLTGAGQQAASPEDFEFDWPDGTFASRSAVGEVGLVITESLAGVYASALTVVSIPSHRRLYASMLASLSRQIAFLGPASGGRAIGISFPPALEIEAASDAIEAYLG